MRKLLTFGIAAFLSLAFVVDDAEARRLGGGRSLGAQRSIAPSKSVQQTPPATPAGTNAAAPAGTPTGSAPQPAGNRWLGPIAGLAAGLGLGWLIGQGGFGGILGTVLLMALLVMAVTVVLRLIARPRTQSGLQYAASGEPAAATPPPGLGSAPLFGAHPQASIPEGFDGEGFLRQAKLNFVRLQAAHDSGKLEALREFTTDEVFEAVKQDVMQRPGTQQTDVVTLNAELLEVVTEGNTHWASVRFSGMMREQTDAPPQAFEEIWNLSKPVSGDTGWVLAGIQQVQ